MLVLVKFYAVHINIFWLQTESKEPLIVYFCKNILCQTYLTCEFVKVIHRIYICQQLRDIHDYGHFQFLSSDLYLVPLYLV